MNSSTRSLLIDRTMGYLILFFCVSMVLYTGCQFSTIINKYQRGEYSEFVPSSTIQKETP